MLKPRSTALPCRFDMKKHKWVNGQLLQTNKKYSHLKLKQKEKIYQWMYESYRAKREELGRFPDSKDTRVINNACKEQVDGWIEIVRPRFLYSITMMPTTACMIIDEEGIRKHKPINRIGTELYGACSIVGDILILDEVSGEEGPELAGFDDTLAENISYMMNKRFNKERS